MAYDNMERFFGNTKVIVTGNPLRGNISTLPLKEDAVKFFELNSQVPTILVTGGSLGTRTLNEMVLSFLKRKDNTENIQIIWQTGKYYYEEFTRRVNMIEVNSNVRCIIMPFIERMDMAYGASDAVICRSGASTVSELELLGIPTIFVPSPNVAEDHQTANAKSVVEAGGALLVKDSDAVEEGMDTVLKLLEDRQKCAEMSQRLNSMGKPNATKDVTDIILKVINYG